MLLTLFPNLVSFIYPTDCRPTETSRLGVETSLFATLAQILDDFSNLSKSIANQINRRSRQSLFVTIPLLKRSRPRNLKLLGQAKKKAATYLKSPRLTDDLGQNADGRMNLARFTIRTRATRLARLARSTRTAHGLAVDPTKPA